MKYTLPPYCFICVLFISRVLAQDHASKRSLEPILGLREDTVVAEEIKEKRVPRSVFLGQKTKRKVLSQGTGTERTHESFWVIPLKQAQDLPVPIYVPYVYVFNNKSRKIIRLPRARAKGELILHGRYVRKWGKIVLDERFFYYGTPHGRWTRRDSKGTLIDKQHYYKGWSRDAQKSYYDLDKRQLKDVIPIQHKKRTGEYYAFHKNGKIAVIGRYKWDKKVNVWASYYGNGHKKRVLQYPIDPLSESSAAIIAEWNQEGRMIYQKH